MEIKIRFQCGYKTKSGKTEIDVVAVYPLDNLSKLIKINRKFFIDYLELKSLRKKFHAVYLLKLLCFAHYNNDDTLFNLTAIYFNYRFPDFFKYEDLLRYDIHELAGRFLIFQNKV